MLCLHPQGCLRRGVRASGPHSSILAWRIPWTSPWGHKESDTTEQLSGLSVCLELAHNTVAEFQWQVSRETDQTEITERYFRHILLEVTMFQGLERKDPKPSISSKWMEGAGQE